MAVLSFFSRMRNFALTIQLCFLGAICGVLYALIFFGFIHLLLLLAALAGATIVLFYSLLEFFILNGVNFKKRPLINQFSVRVVCYALLFMLAFSLLSFLHASYSYHISGDPVQIILAEDYFPFWLNYLFYAFLAAVVFQCLWLLNSVSRQNANLYFVKEGETRKILATILVVFIKTADDNNTISVDEKIELLNKLCEKISFGDTTKTLNTFEQDKLKICITEELTESKIRQWQKILYAEFERHISTQQKMLQLYIGYAVGEVHLHKLGEQVIFYGEPLAAAESRIKLVTDNSMADNAQLQTPLSVIL